MATTQHDQLEGEKKRKACVIGGTGFVASSLIKLLLLKGYVVHTTVRNPADKRKTSHLLALQDLGDLKIFQADLTTEGSFDPSVEGCDFVFLVATPVNFATQDPENELIKAAVEGVTNVLRSCSKAKSVKRIILTSSAAAVFFNKLTKTGLVKKEDDWSDVDSLYSEKPPVWSYVVSKTLAERTAWKFAQENNLPLITILPSVVAGPSLAVDIPKSNSVASCLFIGDESTIDGTTVLKMGLSGGIPLVHVEDVSRAHVFLAEKESASGRYICCALNISLVDLADFLCKRYPQYTIPTKLGDFPSQLDVIISSEKLVKEGFEFKYGIEEIYDQTVEYMKSKGVLKN